MVFFALGAFFVAVGGLATGIVFVVLGVVVLMPSMRIAVPLVVVVLLIALAAVAFGL